MSGARDVITEAGEARGRLTGFSHLVLVCRDMDRSVRFYRDLLGLKIVRTSPRQRGYEKQYFFALTNGELLALYQMADVAPGPAPVVAGLWPAHDGDESQAPTRMDHFAFNVDSIAELEWFRDHLRGHGVSTSDVVGDRDGMPFLPGRLYFSDPDGNPLEIATAARADPRWRGFDERAWLRDDEPVAPLVAAPSPEKS
jgi:catechol 2,3-dioxygenase-like lactoylglutathione lyase family enzyme